MTAAVLSAALSMTSCSNEADELVVPAAKKMMSVTLTLPDDAGTRATFEAKMDGYDFKGLKTAWEKNDEISVGKMGEDVHATFTVTAVSDDGKSATFSGEALESWGEIANGTNFWFTYPVLLEGDYVRDWSVQDGTLASLPNYDDLWFLADYSDGKFDMADLTRQVAFLRLPKGLAICDESFTGSITLEITGTETSPLFSKEESLDLDGVVSATTENPIVVGPISIENGILTDDVYVSLPMLGSVNSIGITVKSSASFKLYSLNYELYSGKIYTLQNMDKLTKPAVGMVIGKDGGFYANATAATDAGTTAVAMIAYLGTAPEGGDGDATTTHGLAIALEDASGNTTSHTGARTAISTWAESNAIPVGTWRLPTPDDFKYMFQGCGGPEYSSTLSQGAYASGNFCTMLTDVGGTALKTDWPYWLDVASGSNWWDYWFVDSKFFLNSNSYDGYARAVLAF